MKNVKGDDNALFLLKELRHRIAQISSIECGADFFGELANLVDWMLTVRAKFKGLDYLEEQMVFAQHEIVKVRGELFDECLKVWESVSLSSKSDVRAYLRTDHRYREYDPIDNVDSIIKRINPYNADYLYHEIRWIFDVLAGNPKYLEEYSQYFIFHINGREPDFSGGNAFNIFLEFTRLDTQLKDDLGNTVWGAWEQLKHMLNLANGGNRLVQFSEWAKVYKKPEYVLYSNRVANYLFDVIMGIVIYNRTLRFDDISELVVPDMKTIGEELYFWEDHLSFDSTKSYGAHSSTFELASNIASSESGITYEQAKRVVKSDDPSPIIANINLRLRSSQIGMERSGIVNVIQYGRGKGRRLLFRLIPVPVFSREKVS